MRNPNQSLLSRAFQDELSHAFREKLFPGEWGNAIAPEDTVEYEYRRRRSENDNYLPAFSVEQELYGALWPHSNNSKPLVIVRGDSGSGKSTLLRFFFDFFIAHYDHLRRYGSFPVASEDDAYTTESRRITLKKNANFSSGPAYWSGSRTRPRRLFT